MGGGRQGWMGRWRGGVSCDFVEGGEGGGEGGDG